ncbi:hypothetical protein CHARACLAT_013190 [Characodon lateralis]|uniref:Uncharacterized protein n=1 Tax=Characodon lateralis TaxID=208331 RepID=A0ABU7CRY3_9TELE|nr:hypothetical protein [Characodon lateralis]
MGFMVDDFYLSHVVRGLPKLPVGYMKLSISMLATEKILERLMMHIMISDTLALNSIFLKRIAKAACGIYEAQHIHAGN